MISIRSTCSSGMKPQAGAPVVVDPRRIPSTRTRAWLLLLPRRNTDASVPGPPRIAISMPGCRTSSSLMVAFGPALWISLASITDTSESTSLARWAWRVAGTNTGARAASCSAAPATEDMASGSSAARGFKRGFIASFLFPAGVPACRNEIEKEAQGNEGQSNRRHTPVALPRFVPGRYPGLQVLTYRLPRFAPSGLVIRPHLLTVAGAAAEWSVWRRTAFPFNCAWRIRAQHLTRRAFYMCPCCGALCISRRFAINHFENKGLVLDHAAF